MPNWLATLRRLNGRLETKLLLLLGVGFLALCLVVSVLMGRLLQAQFDDLERKDLARSWGMADNLVQGLAGSLRDRAKTATKSPLLGLVFADGPQNVVLEQFARSQLEALGVDGVIILDADGRVAFSALRPAIALQPEELADNPLTRSGEDGAGLVRKDGYLFAVSSQQIPSSSPDAAPAGRHIFVREVNKSRLEFINEKLGLTATIHPEVAGPWQASSVADSPGMLQGSGPLLGFGGTPVGTLNVVRAKSTRQTMGASIGWAAGLVLALGLLAALGVFVLTRRLVTGPLLRLHKAISHVDPATGAGLVPVEGTGEIADVSRAINALVFQVGRFRTAVMLHQEFLAQANLSLEEQVQRRTYQLQKVNGLLQHALDGIITLDQQGAVVRANAASKAIFDRSVMEGQYVRDLLEEESKGVFDAALRRLTDARRVEADLVLLPRPRGARYVQAVLIRDREEDDYLFLKDVSEHKRLAEELAHQAYHDVLTGLPNRHGLQRAIKDLAAEPEGWSGVLFIDLDDFKLVNDSLGHEVGDLVLIKAASVLGSCIRPGDFLARLGGDEFILVLKNINGSSEAELVAERVVRSLKQPQDIKDHRLTVTASVGIAVCSNKGLSLADLLQAADTAMYHSKSRGKSSYTLFSPTMSEEVQERQELVQAMREALETRQFQLHYQPIICFSTGDMLSAEALVRWNHPVRGPISPSKFISIAEDTGLIVPIGEWVLREACSTARLLQDLGSFTGIAANVSHKQIAAEGFVELVRDCLEETDLEPSRLTLELTESLAMEDPELTTARLSQLRALGVKLAIDDFGTGYSSLSQLQTLAVDKVKMDRSFVQDLSADSERVTVVAAIISICRALNLEAIAEGVETEGEATILRTIGCDSAQGYFYSHPLHLHDFLERVQSFVLRHAA